MLIPIYTFSGIKKIKKLPDYSYGEWLIYQNNEPRYYFNIFDRKYSDIHHKISDNIEMFLVDKLKGKKMSIRPKIIGICDYSKVSCDWMELEKLPLNILD